MLDDHALQLLLSKARYMRKAGDEDGAVLLETLVEIARTKPKPPWSPEWPTEPGWYWFWGVWYMDLDGSQGLRVIEVSRQHELRQHELRYRPSRGPCLYSYNVDESRGLWLPLETPELPEGVVPDGD